MQNCIDVDLHVVCLNSCTYVKLNRRSENVAWRWRFKIRFKKRLAYSRGWKFTFKLHMGHFLTNFQVSSHLGSRSIIRCQVSILTILTGLKWYKWTPMHLKPLDCMRTVSHTSLTEEKSIKRKRISRKEGIYITLLH